MEIFSNAIMAEIANRLVSFLVDKYWKMAKPTLEDKRLQDLQRLLLRVHVIVEEAEGRHITNQAMVRQLNMLRKEMYRGYFTLDSLRSQGNEEEKVKHNDVNRCFSLSNFNPAKRLVFSTSDIHRVDDLQQVLDNLNHMIVDVSEFVTFLNNYHPLYRQPYSMHLFVGKCMFGRQMEMDRIMDFLMQKEHFSKESVGVLPVVGPIFVGKSTLVANVCNDARVRNHFSQIILVNGDDINRTLKDRASIIRQNNTSDGNQRLLAIIECSRDVHKVAWDSFYLQFAKSLGRGSKIIITSRSNKITEFGTTQTLVLNYLPREAYWYFFKILTFGSVDSSDHPQLQSIAMEISRLLNGRFISANIHSGLLRDNFTAQYWHKHLKSFKEDAQRNIALFHNYQNDLRQKSKHYSYRINQDEFLIYLQVRSCLSENDVPTITMYDLISGSVKCEGEIEVLLWKSHILPYKYYILNCALSANTPL
ncbi:hypothetical protein ACP70R_015176 [Stipagrostis hirtigluma subsp. patula]